MLRLYLKTYRTAILMSALFAGVAAVIFELYRLPAAAVGYTVLVCGFLGTIYLALHYGRFCRRRRELEHLLRGLNSGQEGTALLERLPEAHYPMEEDYQELLRTLRDQHRALREQMEEHFRELVDYYTTWAHQIKTPIAAMRLMLADDAAVRCETTAMHSDRAGLPDDMDTAYSGGTDLRNDTDDLPDGMDTMHSSGNGSTDELREELQRIEQYVEMVLCYLRLDADATDYVIREYDLDGIVRQAVRRHAPAFIRRKLRLTYEPLGARVVTDEKWLLFVIDQILSNALKYTVSGGISITLEAPKTLCIRDTGIGIAPEDLPRIFEKGYTGLNGREDKRASGIGMYLCRRICNNLGHGISVASSPGVGTEVRLDLKNAELEFE